VDLTLSKPKTVSILLVEDEGDYAHLVRDMLEEAWSTEFEVTHVEAGGCPPSAPRVTRVKEDRWKSVLS
jgi:hypothetical protein